MFAVRNPNLCSKECLCLFVCPTGATSTEDGTIDASKCVDGCRLCVDACPEHAIYLVPNRFPETPSPSPPLLEKITPLLQTRAALRTRLSMMAESRQDEVWKRIFRALELSSKILGEDCVRAAGQLTPQAGMLSALLEKSVLSSVGAEEEQPDGTTPATEILDLLLAAVGGNRDADWVDVSVCKTCGAIHRESVPKTCGHCGSADLETIP